MPQARSIGSLVRDLMERLEDDMANPRHGRRGIAGPKVTTPPLPPAAGPEARAARSPALPSRSIERWRDPLD